MSSPFVQRDMDVIHGHGSSMNMDDFASGSHQETVTEIVSPLQEEESRRTKNRRQRKSSTESLVEKPWTKPGADITDYFNYGFTEETWEVYYVKQKKMRYARRMMESVSRRVEGEEGNREEQTGRKKKVDKDRRHQKEQSRPCSASDSRSLFPRRRNSTGSLSQDRWSSHRRGSSGGSSLDRRSGGSKKSSSSAEDSATHLFTLPDFMCPSDPHFQSSPVPVPVTMDRREGRARSRDRKERRERQREERKRERRREEDKPSCSNTAPQKEQGKDRVRRTRGCRGGKNRKRKRRDKETAKETSPA